MTEHYYDLEIIEMRLDIDRVESNITPTLRADETEVIDISLSDDTFKTGLNIS